MRRLCEYRRNMWEFYRNVLTLIFCYYSSKYYLLAFFISSSADGTATIINNEAHLLHGENINIPIHK